jgi:hypothetical protein
MLGRLASNVRNMLADDEQMGARAIIRSRGLHI